MAIHRPVERISSFYPSNCLHSCFEITTPTNGLLALLHILVHFDRLDPLLKCSISSSNCLFGKLSLSKDAVSSLIFGFCMTVNC